MISFSKSIFPYSILIAFPFLFWKCFAQLFSNYILGLWFFVKRISAQKLLVKCLWNWLLPGRRNSQRALSVTICTNKQKRLSSPASTWNRSVTHIFNSFCHTFMTRNQALFCGRNLFRFVTRETFNFLRQLSGKNYWRG